MTMLNDPFPPVSDHELINSHAIDDIDRVVMTETGVWVRHKSRRSWVEVCPRMKWESATLVNKLVRLLED